MRQPGWHHQYQYSGRFVWTNHLAGGNGHNKIRKIILRVWQKNQKELTSLAPSLQLSSETLYKDDVMLVGLWYDMMMINSLTLIIVNLIQDLPLHYRHVYLNILQCCYKAFSVIINFLSTKQQQHDKSVLFQFNGKQSLIFS